MDVSEWAKLLRQLFTITFNLSVMYKYKLRRGNEIEIEKFRNTDFHHCCTKTHTTLKADICKMCVNLSRGKIFFRLKHIIYLLGFISKKLYYLQRLHIGCNTLYRHCKRLIPGSSLPAKSTHKESKQCRSKFWKAYCVYKYVNRIVYILD